MNELMILHFFAKKGNLRTIRRINNKNSDVVRIVQVFCEFACACASAGVRGANPSRRDRVRNPSLRTMCEGHPRRLRNAPSAPQRAAHTPFRAASPARYISHVCRSTAASVFIYALIFFHNIRMLGTLETVCVIDDKTKYSAR